MSDTEKRLEKLFAEILEVSPEKIRDKKDADIFADLKVDSLLGLEIISAVEIEFNIKIDDEEIKGLNTFNSILDIVNKKINRPLDSLPT